MMDRDIILNMSLEPREMTNRDTELCKVIHSDPAEK
jgi:hypothetical protein